MISIITDDAASLAPLAGRRIVVVGYGNQARAQALNLRDSGLPVTVALRARRPTRACAERDGFRPVTPIEGARRADVLLLLIPDESQTAVYRALAPSLRRGAALGFAHGFALVFGGLRPRRDLDAFVVAPAGPGSALRGCFEAGGGIPALVAIAQDATGAAGPLAVAYAKGIGCTRAGAVWTTTRDEVVVDLFGEQAVLCGGISALAGVAYETLVDAGYPPEMAYLECVQQLKLTVDLLHERGPDGLRDAISTTALFGARGMERALRAGGLDLRMRAALGEIESGAFGRRFLRACRRGDPRLNMSRPATDREKEMAEIGRAVRSLFLRGRPSSKSRRRSPKLS